MAAAAAPAAHAQGAVPEALLVKDVLTTCQAINGRYVWMQVSRLLAAPALAAHSAPGMDLGRLPADSCRSLRASVSSHCQLCTWSVAACRAAPMRARATQWALVPRSLPHRCGDGSSTGGSGSPGAEAAICSAACH